MKRARPSLPVPVSPSSSTEASLAAMRRGEVEQWRRCRARRRPGGAAGGPARRRARCRRRASSAPKERRAGAVAVARTRDGVRRRIDDQIVGRGAGLLAGGEDGEAFGPAVLRGERWRTRARRRTAMPASAGFCRPQRLSLTPIIKPLRLHSARDKASGVPRRRSGAFPLLRARSHARARRDGVGAIDAASRRKNRRALNIAD